MARTVMSSSPTAPSFLLAMLPLLVPACGGAPGKPASTGPASPSTQQLPAVSYFVRTGSREQLLGTLAPDGTLTRNPELAAGDEDASSVSKLLSVKLDAEGRPLPSPAAPTPDEPRATWSLGEDGSVTCRIDPPWALSSKPIVFRRGFRVLPDGSAALPTLGISYLLRNDGTVVQRFRDGREEEEPRWRVEGLGGNKRRVMVGLVILDDFFDTGGGIVD